VQWQDMGKCCLPQNQSPQGDQCDKENRMYLILICLIKREVVNCFNSLTSANKQGKGEVITESQ